MAKKRGKGCGPAAKSGQPAGDNVAESEGDLTTEVELDASASTGRPLPPTPSALQLTAVIDVGSGAARMAIGEIAPGRPLRRLEIIEAPLALGLDTISRGHIRSVTTETVIRTLDDFTTVLAGYGIDPLQCRVVATTAVRDARNRDVFLNRVEQACGLRIEVIEAIEELRIQHQYVRMHFADLFEAGQCMLLALGAGGTQVILQHQDRVLHEETLGFGLLKLRDLAPEERSAITLARVFLDKVVRAIQRVRDLSRVDALVVMNLEIHRLFDRMVRVKRQQGPSGAMLQLTGRQLTLFQRRLDGVTTDEVAARADTDYNTAERGRWALEVLGAFGRATKAKTISVPGASMLDCLLSDALVRVGTAGRSRAMERQCETAAQALGRKYRFDGEHGRQVRRMALQLFDQLQPITHLGRRSRLLLAVAAILHDVGYFVSSRNHERHSAYVIESSEIMGLRRSELHRVGLVTRLHRRPFVTVGGEQFGRLPAAERVEVLKLGALLRLAEALDQDHSQRVERIRTEVMTGGLRVLAETRSGDRRGFLAVQQAFVEKADLFLEVFGMEPTVTEVLAR